MERASSERAGRGPAIRRLDEDAALPELADECAKLNEAFNHWIVHRTPFVTVKAAMTLDGKIATASGESKWITGEKARAHGMKLRRGSDAILVGSQYDSGGQSIAYRDEPGKHSTSNIQRSNLQGCGASCWIRWRGRR